MGFLHKLWDETVAGPAPESGLGKLRKYNSFSGSRLAAAADDPLPISRSITILRGNSLQIPNLNVYDDSASLPSSPAASSSVPTTPRSPTTPDGTGNLKKLTRRNSTSAALPKGEPRSPTGYDWIVLSALDR
ncbi:hypothetical protein M9H77_15206 [Catharanthus roseus]|uniref:Uncharacterized protein n=1 Tax=Catharanthus roseus TaxID=4058 RepID=A0ACC0AWH2_CATRO|nr:hypothetical protein M9H77_15206 [Catharanthus roseus]